MRRSVLSCPECALIMEARPKHAGQQAGRRASWPVGRVLCTHFRGPAVIHLGLPLPAASCGLPADSGEQPSNARAGTTSHQRHRALLTLLQVGFTKPPQSPAALVVSYTTVSPLPSYLARQARRRSVFCGTFPRVTPGRRYRPPCPAEPGPSSAIPANRNRRDRPASLPVAPQNCKPCRACLVIAEPAGSSAASAEPAAGARCRSASARPPTRCRSSRCGRARPHRDSF